MEQAIHYYLSDQGLLFFGKDVRFGFKKISSLLALQYDRWTKKMDAAKSDVYLFLFLPIILFIKNWTASLGTDKARCSNLILF